MACVRIWRLLWLVAWLLLPIGVGRAEQVFYYLDKQGSVASVSKLGLVPEPFATAYLSLQKAGNNPASFQQPVGVYGLGAPVEDLYRQRETFRHTLLYWRRQMIVSLQKLVAEQAVLAQLQQNPTLAQIPPLREEIEQQLLKITQAQDQVQHAIQVVTVQLPKQASQQQIPPAWFGP